MSEQSDNDIRPPHDSIREIIYLIRRLMQAGSLYTKELNKKYNVSAPQLNSLVALSENGPLLSVPDSQIHHGQIQHGDGG